MRSEFEKWYRDKYQVTKQLYFFEDMQRYEDGFAQDALEVWQHQQSKVDELQKRVDAAKYYIKNIFSGDAEVDQCHLGDMLDILDGKTIDELEQTLKGGGG